MYIRTKSLTSAAMLAAFLMPCATAQQPDTFGGLWRVMTDSFNDWKKSHEEFDAQFAAQVRQRLATTAAASGSTDLCRTDQKAFIAALKLKLEAQIQAQSAYYQRHAGAAAEEQKTQEGERAKIVSQERQRVEILKRAQEEMAMLKVNLSELQRSATLLKPSSGTPSPEASRQPDATQTEPPHEPDPPAVRDLASAQRNQEEAIALAQDKIDTLEALGKNIGIIVDSRTRIVMHAKAMAEMSLRSLTTLEIQKQYWMSFYDMRSTQVVELCGQTQIRGPLKLQIQDPRP